jgi:hypothetical protein
MVQIIQPYKTKVLTKDGEIQVFISLELNVNLNSDGLQIKSKIAEAKQIEDKVEDREMEWLIPDFTDEAPKIKFGKKVEE